jgi:hypothetical protein
VCDVVPFNILVIVVVNAYGDKRLVIPVPDTVPLRVVVPEFVKPVCEVVPFNILVIVVVNAYGDKRLVIPVPETVPFKVVVPEFVKPECEVVPFNRFVILVSVAYVLLAVVLNKYEEREDERAYEFNVDEVT